MAKEEHYAQSHVCSAGPKRPVSRRCSTPLSLVRSSGAQLLLGVMAQREFRWHMIRRSPAPPRPTPATRGYWPTTPAAIRTVSGLLLHLRVLHGHACRRPGLRWSDLTCPGRSATDWHLCRAPGDCEPKSTAVNTQTVTPKPPGDIADLLDDLEQLAPKSNTYTCNMAKSEHPMSDPEPEPVPSPKSATPTAS